jgi:hypothetical protein
VKKLAWAFCAVVILGAGAAPAFADAPPAAVAAAPAPSPHALELAQRYIRATRMEQTMGRVMDQMMPAMLNQMLSNNPNVTEEQKHQITATVSEAASEASKAFFHKYFEKATVVIAQTYTETELEKLAEFFESPIGQSMMDKTPLLTQRIQGVAMELLPAFQADMQTRLCAKVDCAAQPQSPPTSH